MSSIDPIFWLIAAIGFVMIEAMTFGMTSIWFAVGAAAALLTGLFSDSFRVQAVVFVVVSALCLAAFRPLAARLRTRHTATYGVNQPISAIESLSATTLRNIIGEMELDHTLTSRDTINSKITAILDEATDKWGIKVNRVEVKNIIPPREIQDAMEKQMKAEREKRAVILKADGEKQAAITAAEGEKAAAILRADAVKQQRILEAEGEAQAILAVQQANADAIRLLNEAMPTDKVLALRSLEALAKVANGKATKLIIPSDLQNLGGVVPSIKELLTDPKE